MHHTHSEEYPFYAYDYDQHGEMKPHALYEKMLNAAWQHVNGTRAGFDRLDQAGHIWVLRRFGLRLLRPPRWPDRVTVTTWGKTVERVRATRDFTLSVAGETRADASSEWLIIDRKTDRITDIRLYLAEFPLSAERRAFDLPDRKLQSPKEWREAARFSVCYSDLDVNGHTTAPVYLKWLCDAYQNEKRQPLRTGYIEINYLSQSFLGDNVSVRCRSTEGLYLAEIVRVGDEKPLCRAALAGSLEHCNAG
jgi:medium-chain acyl-[acyl-carrier-protein] hydrolase